MKYTSIIHTRITRTLTDSTTPNVSPLVSSLPTSGSSTYTTSPNSLYTDIHRYCKDTTIVPRMNAERHTTRRVVDRLVLLPVYSQKRQIMPHLSEIADTNCSNIPIHIDIFVTLGILESIHHCTFNWSQMKSSTHVTSSTTDSTPMDTLISP